LSRGVQVVGAAWRAASRIVAGVGDQVQRTENGHTGQVLIGRTIERSGDAVHVEKRNTSFLVEPLILSKVKCLSVVWPQNHWGGLSVVWFQNYSDDFL
jgi:hypothetical protein